MNIFEKNETKFLATRDIKMPAIVGHSVLWTVCLSLQMLKTA